MNGRDRSDKRIMGMDTLGYRVHHREVLLDSAGLGSGNHHIHHRVQAFDDAPYAQPDKVELHDAEGAT